MSLASCGNGLTRVALAVLVGAAASRVLGADESSGPVAAPNPRAMGAALPATLQAQATDGHPLQVPTSPDSSLVVRSYCELEDDRLLVILPTGKIKMIAAAHTKSSERPFQPADAERMQAALEASGLADFEFAAAGPYLFAYDCSEGYYRHTRSILESMYPGVVAQLEAWGLEPTEPAVPLVVIILPGRAAYDAYAELPPEVVAHYDALSNYVVLYEDRRLWEAAPELAAKRAGYTVAHEGVHQLLANTGVQQRLSRWPQWISEGLPEYFCPLHVHSRLIQQQDAELPERTMQWSEAGMVNDLRMYELLRIEAGSGDVVESLVQAQELSSADYALGWGLVHYLANVRREEFAAYLRDVSRFAPLDARQLNSAGRIDPLFEKHFGSDFAEIETGVQKYLTSQRMQHRYDDPVVNQTHYVVKRVLQQGRSFSIALIVTTSPAAAREWKEQQEAEFDRAKFFTILCKTRHEAEYQVRKLQR